jgi:hypothetical protein
MIKQLLGAEIVSTPWNHLIIDNIFSDDDWNKIEEAGKLIASTVSDGQFNIPIHHPNSTSIIPQATIDIIDKFSNELFSEHQKILEKLDNFNSTSDYYLHAQWGTIKNRTFKIHNDRFDKAMSMIVYLFPTQALGTILYSEQKDDAFHSMVKYKPNRAVMFAPKQGVTWHSYLHYGDETRISLNFYFKTTRE